MAGCGAGSDVVTFGSLALFIISEILGMTNKVQPNSVLGGIKAIVSRIISGVRPPEPPPTEPAAPLPQLNAIGPHHVDIQMTREGTHFFLDSGEYGGDQQQQHQPGPRRRSPPGEFRRLSLAPQDVHKEEAAAAGAPPAGNGI
jgi:hypothetical protein